MAPNEETFSMKEFMLMFRKEVGEQIAGLRSEMNGELTAVRQEVAEVRGVQISQGQMIATMNGKYLGLVLVSGIASGVVGVFIGKMIGG